MPRVTRPPADPVPEPETGERAPLISILVHNNGSTINQSSKWKSSLPLHYGTQQRHQASLNDDDDGERGLWGTVWRMGAAVFLLCLACAGAFTLADNTILRHPTGPHPAPPPPPSHETQDKNPAVLVRARHGAVATENRMCSDIGVETLKKGGNAVDAGVASTLCIGVANLFSSGIGGGGFMTIRVPTKAGLSKSNTSESSSVWAIDFRETAPGASNRTMFVDDPTASLFGGLSVGVPGEVRGLAEAHERWGSLSWEEVVEPAAKLADGWPVGRELAARIRWPIFEEMIFRDPTWRAVFAPNGQLLQEGEIARRPALARTLRVIASEGADAFYKGPLADNIVSAVQRAGGIMTSTDLEEYKAIVYPALMGTYRGKRVYTPKAPTSGPVLLHMLNLLEKYDLEGEGRTGLNTHRFIEVMKFGFAARTKICDPEFTDDISRIDEISTKSFSKVISPNITDETTHAPDYYNPVFDAPMDHGTSHISIVDKDGMAVAITSTVNLIFGSQVLDPVTGILFNDEMDDFSTPGIPNAFGLWPSPWNYPEPNKRPLSSTVPTILERSTHNGEWEFYLATGGSGGSKIFPAVAQVLLGIDAWGLDVSAAIEAGRVHDQLFPTVVEVDSTVDEGVVEALKGRGHNVTVLDATRVAAVVQVVMKDGDTIYAASDSRKNGIAAGY